MNCFDYLNPPRIAFGEGRIAQLKAHGMVAIGELKHLTLGVSQRVLEASL